MIWLIQKYNWLDLKYDYRNVIGGDNDNDTVINNRSG